MPANERDENSGVPTSRRQFLGAAAGLGAASLAAGSAAAAGCGQHDDSDDDLAMPESEPFASIEYSNQFSGGTEIVVDATVLSDGGYVAIHDAGLLQGLVTESVVGVSEFLEAGAHFRLPVTLFDVPGADFDRDALRGTEILFPMPHVETSGNETYDFVASGGEEDGPYTEAGLPTIDAGFATVEESAGGSGDEEDGGETEREGDAGPFATIDFRNQSAAGGSVTVREVTLSEGGFVTLHDARLLDPDPIGSVVGVSEFLEPGQHQAVEIAIDDPNAITELELPARPLLPMPHLDTNGNGTYDFVATEGEEDGPYTKAGQAVIDGGLVTVE